MSYITDGLKQAVTYWAPGAPDGRAGRAFAAPVALTGRWEDGSKMVTGAAGVEVLSTAAVLLSADVAVGGYLYLGTSVTASPIALAGARKILSFDKTPDIDAVEFEREAFLQ